MTKAVGEYRVQIYSLKDVVKLGKNLEDGDGFE
jgi:hypothetical protein